MGSDDETLADLLVRWGELRERGREVGPEELAPDHPRLHPELAQRIAALRAMDWIDRTAGPVEVAPPDVVDGQPDGARLLASRYRLDRLIAEGGSGQVWAGYDEELQRPVAVKVPRPRGLSARPPVDFLAEGRRVAKLEHPGIVPVYDVGQDGGQYYIVSKLVDGESLADRLHRLGRFAPAEAARLVSGVARSLEFAHRQGFVHRDIKPANILLDAADRPFLTDFGIAVATLELETASRAGTLAYMAPEQLAREGGRLDHRADVYGLGVVLYEMLAGRQPFQADDPVAVRDAIMAGNYHPLLEITPTVPAALSRIVTRCMATDAEKRYQTAGQVADELEACSRSRRRIARLVIPPVVFVGLVAVGVYHLRPAPTPVQTEPVHDQPPLIAPYVSQPPQTTYGRETGAAVGASGTMARRQLVGHAGRVNAVAFRPNGRSLASGGADKTARIWHMERPDPSDGHLILRHPDAVTAVAFRPDGARLAVGCGNGQVSLWNLSGAEPKEEAVYPGHDGPVTGLAFSPDGTIILSGGADGRVILRDFNSTPPRTAGFPKLNPVLAVASDGRRVTLGYGDQKLDPAVFHFWEIDPTKTPKALHHRGSAPLAGAPGVGAMAASSDGARLFAATGLPIGAWEFSAANKRFDLLGTYEKHLRAVRAVAVSPDGRRAVSGDEGGAVHVWEVATRETVRAFASGHTGSVASATFSGDGREAASGGGDGVIRLWRLLD